MAHYRYWIQRHVLSHSPWSATSCTPVQSSMARDPGSSSAYFILQAAPFIWNCCWEALDDYTYYSNKSAQDKKKFPKRKTIVYLLKKSLKHYSLLPFIISPFARRYCDSCLCFQSFNNGTILYYSDLLTGLRRIMSKEKKREAVLTC